MGEPLIGVARSVEGLSDGDTRSLVQRVAMLTPRWPPGDHPNGIVSFVARMRQCLVARGLQVPVLAMATGGHDDADVFDVEIAISDRSLLAKWYGLLFRFSAEFSLQRRVSAAIVEAVRLASMHQPIDILQMEETFGLAANVKRNCGVPVVVRLSGPWFLVGPASNAVRDGLFRRRVIREGRGIVSADAVIAPSRHVLEAVRSFYGVRLPNAAVIPGPAPVVPEGERWRRSECDPALVLFVGRFDRVKGGDVMIDAFGRLLRRMPRTRLCFAGPDHGYTDDRGRTWSLSEYVERSVPTAMGRGQVDILGAVSRARLDFLRRRAMVTVVCSRFENLANTLLEAMAVGCPVIASAVGGLPEVVEDGRNGLLCRSADPQDLTEKICRLLEDRAFAVALGRQAAADCAERYDPRIVAQRTLAFYRQVLSGR